jgi:hypothetical protein
MRTAILFTFVFSSSCGAEGSAVNPCVPGEQRACACPGGGPDGAQICEEDGERFGMCFGCVGAGAETTADAATTSAAPTSGGPAGESSEGSGGADESGSSSSGGVDEPLPGEPSGPPQAVWPDPLPDQTAVVEQVAAEHPDWLQGSCLDTGGNNEFLFEVVRRLRQTDDRWGLNWKRGVVGDMSQDVVDYHYGDGVSEGSTEVYIIDVIVGHCGDTPQAGWIDVTQATLDADTVGMWTLAGQSL